MSARLVANFVLPAFLLLFASGGQAADLIKVSADSRIALGIETHTLSSANGAQVIQATGVVVAPPANVRTITTPFDAVFVQPVVPMGAQVEKGAPLAILQSAAYAAARNELEKLDLTARHMTHLEETAEELQALGLRSEQEAHEAHHEAKSARLNLKTAQGQLSMTSAGAGYGQFNLLSAMEGQVVHIAPQAGSTISALSPVVRLFDGRAYWVRISLPVSAARALRVGDGIIPAEGTGEGAIVAIDPEIDPTTRSIDIMASLPGVDWRVGALLDVRIPVQKSQGGMQVPSQSVVRVHGQYGVFVERGDGFAIVPVEVISAGRDNTLVKGTLAANDKVVSVGTAALKNMAEGG